MPLASNGRSAARRFCQAVLSARDCFREEECSFYRMEIAYSHFERIIDLPCNLESARITTEYQYGMLLVRIQTEAEL